MNYKVIYLLRVTRDNPNGTFGIFKYQEIPFAVSYELPWLLNKRNVSCIPEGDYLCTQHIRPDGKVVYDVNDVPDRTLIEIHIGNNKRDVKGCICPGEKYEPIGHELSVQESTHAMKELIGIIKPDSAFILKIREHEILL